MDTEIINAELIQLVNPYMAMRFLIPSLEAPDSELHAMLAIDISKSMSGPPIQDAKGALTSLIQKFKKADTGISVFLFSNKLTELNSGDIGYDALLEAAGNISASGGTLFAPVLKGMYDQIQRNHYKNVFSVWLTDGQDGRGLDKLIPTMDKFKQLMVDNEVSIAVHTIGFSADHDSQLLNRLSLCGTKNGSFQYVPAGGRIPVAVNNVYNLAFTADMWAKFVPGEGREGSKVAIEDAEFGEFVGLVYVDETELENCTVEVHKGEVTAVYRVEPKRSEIEELKEIIYLVANFVSFKVISALEGDQRKLAGIAPLIQEMKRRLIDLQGLAKTHRVFYQKQCEPFLESSFELINKYNATLQENAGAQLSNVQLANLNSAAHRTGLKKNLERQLARRVGGNIIMLNESEELIEKVVKTLNMEEMQKKYSDSIPSYGECLLTTRNWVEAVSEGDCFCLTLHIKRPLDLLGDALQVKVLKINTTLLTCDGFIQSALFETKAGQIIQGQRNYQHGKSPLPAGSLVNGLPDEVINGILPIYINPEHWAIARLRIRTMIAWDITVDVLGFYPKQLYVFPFNVLARAVEDAETEFSYFQLRLIKETCVAVYLDEQQEIGDYVKQRVQQYIDFPENRLPEKIANNTVFLAQLYCAYTVGDVPKAEHIFPYVFEEEFRRSIKLRSDQSLSKFIKAILDIDPRNHVQELEENLKEWHFTGNFSHPCERAVNLLEKTVKTLQKGGFLHTLLKVMELFGCLLITDLESVGLVTNEQKLALLIQSFRDSTNIARKQSLAEGNYINVFDPEQSLLFLQKLYTDTVKQEFLVIRKMASVGAVNSTHSKRAIIFAYTFHLEEAAAALKDTTQGSPYFALFYKALMDPQAEFPAQKLMMLNRGSFNDELLIVDYTRRDEKRVTWVPSNEHFHRIWKSHTHKASKEEWQNAVPEKHDYIERKYLRFEGQFVAYSRPKANVNDRRHWRGGQRNRRGK